MVTLVLLGWVEVFKQVASEEPCARHGELDGSLCECQKRSLTTNTSKVECKHIDQWRVQCLCKAYYNYEYEEVNDVNAEERRDRDRRSYGGSS